jgi:uncharacterized membrane protein YgcG
VRQKQIEQFKRTIVFSKRKVLAVAATLTVVIEIGLRNCRCGDCRGAGHDRSRAMTEVELTNVTEVEAAAVVDVTDRVAAVKVVHEKVVVAAAKVVVVAVNVVVVAVIVAVVALMVVVVAVIVVANGVVVVVVAATVVVVTVNIGCGGHRGGCGGCREGCGGSRNGLGCGRDRRCRRRDGCGGGRDSGGRISSATA